MLAQRSYSVKMWSQSDQTQAKASKSPKVNAVARVVTLITLAISLALMKSNRPTWVNDSGAFFIDYKKISSYQYMLACAIVGLAYNLLQTPFAAYYAIRGKRLINRSSFLEFEFYGDKVILCILATGVGAAFGVTTDQKKLVDDDKDLSGDIVSKYDGFYNMAFVSAGFLFIGFITSGISSIISSRAVSMGD